MLDTVLVCGVHEVNQLRKAPWPIEFSCLHHCFFTQHAFLIQKCFKPSPLSTKPIRLPLEDILDTNFTEEPEAIR